MYIGVNWQSVFAKPYEMALVGLIQVQTLVSITQRYGTVHVKTTVLGGLRAGQ